MPVHYDIIKFHPREDAEKHRSDSQEFALQQSGSHCDPQNKYGSKDLSESSCPMGEGPCQQITQQVPDVTPSKVNDILLEAHRSFREEQNI